MGSWQIPLEAGKGVTPIQTPFQTQSQALGLQQMAQARAIQRQTMAENALKIQSAQEDQNDQKTIQDAFHDQSNWSVNPATGKNAPDTEKIRTAIAPSVRLRNLQSFDNTTLSHQRMASALSTEDIANGKAWNQEAGGILESMLKTKEGSPERQAVHDAGIARLQAMKVPANIIAQIPTAAMTDEQLKSTSAALLYNGTLLTNAERQQKIELESAQTERAAAAARRSDATAKLAENQQDREEAARSHLAIGTLPPEEQQAAHEEWLSNLPDSIKSQYQNLKKYTPEVAGAVQDMAMSSQQRAAQTVKETNAQSAAERAAAAGGKAGLAAKATDPTASQEDRDAAQAALDLLGKGESKQTANAIALQHRFNQREADAQGKQQQKDSDEHNKLRQQEIDQTANLKALQEGIAKGSSTVQDPKTGKAIPIEQAKAQADAAREKAATLWDQQAQLRQQHKWGEYSPGSAASVANPWRSTPAANPPAQGGGRGAVQTGAPAAKPSSAAPKTTTMAMVQAFAKAHNMDLAAAKVAVKNQGYKITDEQ